MQLFDHLLLDSGVYIHNACSTQYISQGPAGCKSPSFMSILNWKKLAVRVELETSAKPWYDIMSRTSSSKTLRLCLVGVNDFGRNGMKNELSYGHFLKNFILSSISFLTSCVRYHTYNLRWNAPFSHILNFFSNLIIAILHFLKIFSKLSSYLH